LELLITALVLVRVSILPFTRVLDLGWVRVGWDDVLFRLLMSLLL
jgi:hypothetical protein